MKRTLTLIVFVGALPHFASASGDAGVSKKCVAAEHNLGAFPRDQLNVLRIDSELRLLALHGTNQPSASIPMARSLVAEIQSLPNIRLRGLLNSRLAPIYVRIDRTEAADWLASLPSKEKEHTYEDYKARAYSEAVGAWQDLPEFQMELVSRGLGSGAFQIAQVPALLQKLQKQDRGRAIALFRQVMAAFPSGRPSDQDVWVLLRLAQIMVDSSTEDVRTAVTLMIAALNNPNLQTSPQRDLPEFLSVQINDRDTPLKAQVKSMAMMLDVNDGDSGGSIPPLGLASSTWGVHNGEPAASSSLLFGVNGAGRSAEFQIASKALNSATSEDEVLRLANSIKDKAERAQFFLLALRRLQSRPASIAHLAGIVLGVTDGSADPGLSLTVPRMVFHSAMLANDSATEQLALASLARGAQNVCNDSHTGEGDAFADGSVCIQEYAQVASEIASSPLRQTLQISDPSLVERLEMADVQDCDSSANAIMRTR